MMVKIFPLWMLDPMSPSRGDLVVPWLGGQALRAGRAAEMEEAGYLVAGGDPQTVKLEAPGSRRAEGCDGKMVSKTLPS